MYVKLKPIENDLAITGLNLQIRGLWSLPDITCCSHMYTFMTTYTQSGTSDLASTFLHPCMMFLFSINYT